jgi:uncharacterized RDD family membrane protein YckC
MTADTPQPPAPETPATPPPAPPPAAPQPAWAPPPQPAGPAAGLRYAGFWVRVVAFILDGIVIGVVSGALGPLLGQTAVTIENGVYTIDYTTTALSGLIGLLYWVGFWAWRGQSPGMIPFNMRIVMADDGSKVDVVRSLLRYVGLIISFAVLFIGVIWVGFDKRKQGWHDKIAGTVVVRPA